MAFPYYFLQALLKSKRHGALLALAAVALGLSSFALLVLQSTMGGLQRGVESRSQYYKSQGTILFELSEEIHVREVVEKLRQHKMAAVPVLELEVLAKNGAYTAPARVWGIDPDYPLPFVEHIPGPLIGADLSFQIKAIEGQNIEFIIPTATDPLLGDIPRSMFETIGPSLVTQLPDLDSSMVLVRDSSLQNVLRFQGFNQIKIFGPVDERIVHQIISQGPLSGASFRSWEKENQTLVWALRLESTIMLFLFASMSVLVSLAIVSGLMLFFSKIRRDLVAFWVLGMGLERLKKEMQSMAQILCLAPILAGIVLGFFCLVALDQWGGEIMPAVFVERKIPVSFHWRFFLLSFLIPYLISSSASALALKILGMGQGQFIQYIKGQN